MEQQSKEINNLLWMCDDKINRCQKILDRIDPKDAPQIACECWDIIWDCKQYIERLHRLRRKLQL